MKIKKRYFVACILMCVIALVFSVAMFYLEMGLARYSKLNKVVTTSWVQTSASDPETGVNTDLFVTRVYKDGEQPQDGEVETWSYIGNQSIVDGKYVAYGKETYGNGIIINGDIKMGDKVTVYYKPDNPTMVYYPVSYMQYVILIAGVVVLTIVMIIVCRIINKSLKDNTFSDAAVTIMDIPMAVFVVGIVLAFFAGMLIGNIQVDDTYTVIREGIANQFATHELAF